jgi:hypothetical protein
MAPRKIPRKAPTGSNGLVPALRDAVEVVDRALEALGRAAKKQKRAVRGKSRKA